MTKRSGAWWGFWAAIGLIVYTYVGFPLLTALRGLLRRQPLVLGSGRPRVSVIIAAHNEAAGIARKLDNTLALDYPQECFEIIVASDGSNDGTNELVQHCGAPHVRLLALPRQGKNSAVNTAVAAANAEILVFTDADTLLAPDALHHLIAPFGDPTVGGVCGEHRPALQARNGWNGKAKYRMKTMLSSAGSTTAGDGQIYAMRRDLFQPMPRSVNDDLYNFLQVPASHQRLVFAPQAVAYPLGDDAGRHAVFQRKVRINTRLLQTFWVMRRLLNPLRYGFYAIQLASHKLLRRFVFPATLVTGLTSTMLWRNGRFYRVVAAGHGAFYVTAVVGLALSGTRLGRIKILRKPYTISRNGVAFLVALVNFATGKRYEMWTHSDTAQ